MYIFFHGHKIQDPKILTFEYLKNENSFLTFVLSFALKKQNSKNISDTDFKQRKTLNVNKILSIYQTTWSVTVSEQLPREENCPSNN